MEDADKTKKALVAELAALRQRVAELKECSAKQPLPSETLSN
jgi:hypothetical protein